MLGKAKKVTIEKENTTIVNGAGKKKDIEGRIAQIKAEVEETASDYGRELVSKMGNFIARLSDKCSSDKIANGRCSRSAASCW
jgi:chaperonin GroEL (HSP60 family)